MFNWREYKSGGDGGPRNKQQRTKFYSNSSEEEVDKGSNKATDNNVHKPPKKSSKKQVVTKTTTKIGKKNFDSCPGPMKPGQQTSEQSTRTGKKAGASGRDEVRDTKGSRKSLPLSSLSAPLSSTTSDEGVHSCSQNQLLKEAPGYKPKNKSVKATADAGNFPRPKQSGQGGGDKPTRSGARPISSTSASSSSTGGKVPTTSSTSASSSDVFLPGSSSNRSSSNPTTETSESGSGNSRTMPAPPQTFPGPFFGSGFGDQRNTMMMNMPFYIPTPVPIAGSSTLSIPHRSSSQTDHNSMMSAMMESAQTQLWATSHGFQQHAFKTFSSEFSSIRQTGANESEQRARMEGKMDMALETLEEVGENAKQHAQEDHTWKDRMERKIDSIMAALGNLQVGVGDLGDGQLRQIQNGELMSQEVEEEPVDDNNIGQIEEANSELMVNRTPPCQIATEPPVVELDDDEDDLDDDEEGLHEDLHEDLDEDDESPIPKPIQRVVATAKSVQSSPPRPPSSSAKRPNPLSRHRRPHNAAPRNAAYPSHSLGSTPPPPLLTPSSPPKSVDSSSRPKNRLPVKRFITDYYDDDSSSPNKDKGQAHPMKRPRQVLGASPDFKEDEKLKQSRDRTPRPRIQKPTTQRDH